MTVSGFRGRRPTGDASHKPSSRLLLDDKTELISKRILLCGKIKNVLCYFKNCDPFVKIKVLRHYCYDFYGSNLWNLAHNNIEDICIAWRKGLRRIWNLPVRTHCRLLGPICSLLPLKYELNCRSASFIVKSLSSANRTVNFVARSGATTRDSTSAAGGSVGGRVVTVGAY